jgi:hypothetical protein
MQYVKRKTTMQRRKKRRDIKLLIQGQSALQVDQFDPFQWEFATAGMQKHYAGPVQPNSND